jgi:hypothetical protein
VKTLGARTKLAQGLQPSGESLLQSRCRCSDGNLQTQS